MGDEFEANINQSNQDQNAVERPTEISEPAGEGRANTIPESKQDEPHGSQNAVPREARRDNSQFPRRQRLDNPADRADHAQQFPQNPQNNGGDGGYGRVQRQQWRGDQRYAPYNIPGPANNGGRNTIPNNGNILEAGGMLTHHSNNGNQIAQDNNASQVNQDWRNAWQYPGHPNMTVGEMLHQNTAAGNVQGIGNARQLLWRNMMRPVMDTQLAQAHITSHRCSCS